MAKKIDLSEVTISSIGTSGKWYKSADIEIINNNGKSDIRLDKAMMQVSQFHTGTASMVMCTLVHLSDETGATLTASITAGTTDDAALETLLNQWKDNVFMTDFRYCGTGADEVVFPVVALEADTRRLLKPGQTLNVLHLARPTTTETTKSAGFYLDSMVWYSAAAN